MPSAARRVPSARAQQSVAKVTDLFNPGAVQQKKTTAARQQVGALQQRFVPPVQPTQFQKLTSAITSPNRAMARAGQRMNLGGPSGRIAALQEGYERTLAFQQPGARGLLAAASASFGGEIDDDTRLLSTLRQAGLGTQPQK